MDGPTRILGTTFAGGSRTYGTAFALRLAKDGTTWKNRIIFNFCNCADGGAPAPGLLEDVHGNLYGITSYGFPQVYKLSQRGSLEVLHTFCTAECSDGSNPNSLTYVGASAGARYDGISPLYGVSSGSPGNGGIVFKLQKEGRRSDLWDFSVVYIFCPAQPCTRASGPESIVADPHGNFFGTAGGGQTGNDVLSFRAST